MKKNISAFLSAAAVITYAVLLIVFYREVSAGIISSVNVCLNVIIPSLYAFSVISGFLISSGLYRILSLPFRPISKYIFRLPCDVFSVFLISTFAGYPIGAKMIGELYSQKRIDHSAAERMLGFCYMGGPAFFCGTAGMHIYSSVKTGMLIFLCILLANITAAFFSGIRLPIPDNTAEKSPLKLSADGFLSSVYAGGAALLKICASVIIFSTFISIADASGILLNAASLLSKVTAIPLDACICIIRSVSEITGIVDMPPDPQLIPVTAALLSFGGLCVIMQTSGFIPKELSTYNFYLSRISVTFMSYLYCKILMYIVGADAFLPVMSAGRIYRHNSPIPSIFLLIMTILLLSNNFIAKSEKI